MTHCYSSFELVLEGFGPEEFQEVEAFEGYNIDTKKSIKNNPKLDQLLEALHDAKQATKEGKVLEKKAHDKTGAIKQYKLAITKYGEAYTLVGQLKADVDNLMEPNNFGEKILSYFTPLWMWKFPREETNGAIYTGSGYVVMTTTYTDTMSKSTKSAIKRSFQERMNLQAKRIRDMIAVNQKYIKRCSQ